MCVDESAVVPESFVPENVETTLAKTAKLLSNSSVAELTEIKELVEKLMREQTAKEQSALKASIEAIAKATGVSVEKVLETLTPTKTRKRGDSEKKIEVRVKYRHPENPELTWTGRGKEPKWLNEAREQFDDQELLAA